MFDLHAEQLGEIAVIHINGAFNMDNLASVKAFIIEQVKRCPRLIAINCGRLDSIDSSAIGFIVQFFNYAADNGIMLIFYDLKPLIRKLFDASKLSRYFKITTRSDFENRYVLNLRSRQSEPSRVTL